MNSESRPTKTTQEAEFSLDLTKLYESEAGGSPVIAQTPESHLKASSPLDLPHKPGGGRRARTASFFGESWYASFLLRVTNNDHNQLHQHVTEHPRIAKDQRDDDTVEDDAQEGHEPAESSGLRPLHSHIPTQDVRDTLIRVYFSRFHVLFPILDKSSFLSSLENGSLSQTLLGCVLFVASIHCDLDTIPLMGYLTRADAGDALFNAAKTSFDAETDVDRVTMLQCAFLLHYWWGQPTNFRDSLWWLATAIRSAQCMGMHRSMRDSRMSQRSKQHWRRLWWCLYVSHE